MDDLDLQVNELIRNHRMRAAKNEVIKEAAGIIFDRKRSNPCVETIKITDDAHVTVHVFYHEPVRGTPSPLDNPPKRNWTKP